MHSALCEALTISKSVMPPGATVDYIMEPDETYDFQENISSNFRRVEKGDQAIQEYK